MNTGDLRIGSIIRGIDNGPIYIVEEIRTLAVRVRYIRPDTNEVHVSIVESRFCEGVTLSPGLFIQLGFTEHSKTAWYETHYTLKNGEEIFNNEIDWYIYDRDFPHFTFLHELQNQLWILSGKDEIKWKIK